MIRMNLKLLETVLALIVAIVTLYTALRATNPPACDSPKRAISCETAKAPNTASWVVPQKTGCP
jgi:hypothetical protein